MQECEQNFRSLPYPALPCPALPGDQCYWKARGPHNSFGQPGMKPQVLQLTVSVHRWDTDFDMAARFVMSPPIRGAGHAAALRAGLAGGILEVRGHKDYPDSAICSLQPDAPNLPALVCRWLPQTTPPSTPHRREQGATTSGRCPMASTALRSACT